MSTDLEALAHAVDVLLDPDNAEGVGTTVHYLLSGLLGLAVSCTEIFAQLREAGYL